MAKHNAEATEDKKLELTLEERVKALEAHLKIFKALVGILGISAAGVASLWLWASSRAFAVGDQVDGLKKKVDGIDQQIGATLEKKVSDLVGPAIESRAENLISRLSVVELANKCYRSEWIAVKSNAYYIIDHNLRTIPTKAWMWASAGRKGEKVVLVDSIYTEKGGYGAWLVDVRENTAAISTGSYMATSLYGHLSQWQYWDNRIGNDNVTDRFIQVVMCP